MKGKRLLPSDVIRIVSKIYDVDVSTLKGRLRTAEPALARAVAGVLIRAHAVTTGSEAARALGRFPQMSAYWRKAVDARLATDPSEAARFAKARKAVRHAMAQS